MSTKFFTWTKGDRRNASAEALRSGGIVPIPAECITFKGMDYARSEKGSKKAGRKPLPLSFDRSPVPSSKHSSRTTESIALQDAAVQSATNLMAVMNDMLRSPQLSAHIQQRSAGLTPMHGRPRSHTAPSTPVFEAPSSKLVELPGSLPVDKNIPPSIRHSMDSKTSRQSVRSSTRINHGTAIERPHSSPQELTQPLLVLPDRATGEFSRSAATYPPIQHLPESARGSFQQLSHSRAEVQGNARDNESVRRDDHSTPSTHQRPSLETVQRWVSHSPGISGSSIASQPPSSMAVPYISSPYMNSNLGQVDHRHGSACESVLLDQIKILRSSHDGHLRSLKETYEKEIESHRSYIQFLEQRYLSSPAQQPQDRLALTIDTSHGPSRRLDRSSLETSATTLQSFDSSLENKKRSSQESTAEVEALKRKLSICRKEQFESAELLRERDQLREASERSNKRILQLKNIVHKAKDNEKALKAATADLEARLEVSNSVRVDCMEGIHYAQAEVKKSAEREKALVKELEYHKNQAQIWNAANEFHQTPLYNKGARSRHGRTASDVSGIPLDKSRPRILDVSRKAFDKEQNSRERVKIAELEAELLKQKELLTAAKADCERYNSLLHREFRRQSRSGTMKTPALGPEIDIEASAEASEKVRSARKRAETSDIEDHTQLTVEILEKELQCCLKEIITFKLDVRGYKKDLKRANAQIESLQANQARRPPTPEREDESNSKNATHTEGPVTQHIESLSNNSGLCISLPPTPARSVTSLGSEASIPKTPLGFDKRLPKAPRQTQQPQFIPPETPKLKRAETLRSISDSIISSYAKMTTPELTSGMTPPNRETRRSAPAKSTVSNVGMDMPISKFTYELLKAAKPQAIHIAK